MFPIAFVFMMSVMGGYAKDYKGAVQATNELSSSMIEYINGIEVIKAFNQGKTSYARLAEKVRANAQYYFDWMRRSQLGMSMAYAFFPAQMLTVLPFGWLFYTHGTLSIGTFLTVIIDPENEVVIQKAVARLMADKTVTCGSGVSCPPAENKTKETGGGPTRIVGPLRKFGVLQ